MDGQPLRGRCAVVTGAGHGLGRAFAARLAADGAQVVLADLDGAAATAAAAELVGEGRSAVALATDVGDPVSVDRMVEGALGAFGRIDILVNNAAVFRRVPLVEGGFESIPLEHFEQVLRVNVIGMWLCARAVVPDMRRRRYGKVINLSSATVFKGAAGTQLQYVTAKSAVLGFTRSLARTLGADGIRVNCVAPGRTDALGEGATDAEAAQPERLRERALPRVEWPADVVGTVSFLAGPDSDFVTGQTIVVDGGAFMH